MSKRQIIIAVAVAVGVFAALYVAVKVLYVGVEPKEKAAKVQVMESNARGLDLLHTVPTNALGVVCCPRVSNAASALRFAESNIADLSSMVSLDYGELSNAPATISFFHLGSLVPMISLDLGKHMPENPAADTLAMNATAAGIKTEITTLNFKNGKRDVMMLSVNENLIASARRHIDSNSSILDAAGFDKALEQASASAPVAIFHNNGAVRLLDANFLKGTVDRSRLTGFLAKFCEWTVIKLESSGDEGLRFGVLPACNQDAIWYANLIGPLQTGESKLADVLPQTAKYVVDLPFADYKAFLDARKNYLEAHTKRDAYEENRAALRKRSGVNPEDWAAELNIKEVARVDWGERQVILIRPEKDPKAHNIKNCTRSGFTGLLFGDDFKLKDESRWACMGHWIVIGDDASVRAFVASEDRLIGDDWPGKGCKLVVKADDYLLYWNKQGLKLQHNTLKDD